MLLRGDVELMVTNSSNHGTRLYLCDECGFGYETASIAEACESHCLRYNACSLEITRYAVYRPKA